MSAGNILICPVFSGGVDGQVEEDMDKTEGYLIDLDHAKKTEERVEFGFRATAADVAFIKSGIVGGFFRTEFDLPHELGNHTKLLKSLLYRYPGRMTTPFEFLRHFVKPYTGATGASSSENSPATTQARHFA